MEKNNQTDLEIIDVEEYSKEGKTPPSGKHYRIRIDREFFVVEKNSLTGRELLELANKDPYTDYQLYQKLKGGLVTKVEYDQSVHFDKPGIERFTTQKKTHTDGEAKKFKIQLDRDVKDAPEKCMTGKQILELFDKTPYSDYQLYIKLKGKNVEKVSYDQVICFDNPGIERFTSQKLKHQDGSEPKCDFDLMPLDKTFLNSLDLIWETVIEQNLHYVIIRGVQLPFGYNVEKTDIAMRLDQTYPRTQIDMAFFYPKLLRTDNRTINAVTDFPIEGKTYQQWSRHRAADNPWREGLDNLETHFHFVLHWLENEFIKTPHAV